ncbi:MAG: hypothetical protein RBT59_00870, partial [Arcobacteraceae bacterium]|nr:hypothetical protein [Arcobacteraceae bacterium]
MKHLIKTRNNSYTFRLIIPKSQRGYFQRTEIKKSLDTKNYIVANAKATILYNGYQEIVRVIKLGALSEEQIHQIVDKYVMNVLNEDKIKRATSTVKYEGVLLDMEAEQYQDFTTTVKDALRGNDFDVAKNIGAQLLK